MKGSLGGVIKRLLRIFNISDICGCLFQMDGSWTCPTCNVSHDYQKISVIFATHGLPEILVSGNGMPVTSAEFQESVSRNTIHHALTSLYHPASNELAVRAIQSFKSIMR